jgi:hypothetical protein
MTQVLSAEASQALSSLEKKWPKLNNDVDRAVALGPVHGKGVPYRLLAEKLNCSESRVRYLCQAAKAPLADLFQARDGKISTRELVRRTDAAEAEKKAKETNAIDLRRTEEAKKAAKIIRDWLESKLGFLAHRENVIDEARRTLEMNKRQGTLPKRALSPDTPVETVIQRMQPPWSVNPDAESIEWYADWLARWAYFAFPDEIIRDRALNIALDKEIREED